MFLKNRSTIGIASLLFFVILVSQSRILDFLIVTFLGRIILISLILYISYVHYILGVVSVLFLIIMLNNINIFEGMENKTTDTASTSSVSSSLATAMNKAKDEVMSKINVTTTNKEAKKEKKQAVEGFDLIGTENTIKRGKQSNAIPVYPHSKNATNISPYDGGTEYSAF
jgi:exopolysaccharide biosynthesis protein